MSLYDVLLARALTPQSSGGDTGGVTIKAGTAATETEIHFAMGIAGAQSGDAEIYLYDLSALSGQVALEDGRPRIVGIRYSAYGGVWLTTAEQSGITQDANAYDPAVLEWGDESVTMTGDLQVNSGAIFVENATYRIFYRA